MGVVRCGREATELQRFMNALRLVIGLDPLYGKSKEVHEINSVPAFWRQQPQELRYTEPDIALLSEGWFARQKARDPDRRERAALMRHPGRH